MAMSPDQTADLWLKIDQLHLNYLKSEENTQKLDIRKKLEGYVHQYLCLVPQERKFCNAISSLVLFESAGWIADFSALKAARAFEAIEKYAANLINQPWRKEFREIKQYGGFYKHQVESFLNAPERIFHLMGYVSNGHQCLVLDGPVDLDRVTVVARDCLLAYVECQIVVSILQGVSAQFPCRWDEILEFRRNHIGSPEQATRTLLYQKNQLQYLQGYPNYYPPAGGAPHPHQQGGAGGVQPPYGQYSPYAPVGSYPTPPGGLITNVGQHPKFPSIHTGGVATSPMSPKGSATIVPTAKLVDLTGSPPFHQNGNGVVTKRNGVSNHHHDNDPGSSGSSTSTLTGQRGPIPLTIKQLEADSRRKTLLAEAAAAAANANEANNPLECWDYVYRQLESIGYTKDQGERPDVLDILSKVGMNPHHRQQLEQRLREQQKYHPGSVDQHPIQNNSQNFQSAKTKHKTSSSSPETEEDAVQPPRPSRQTPQYASVRKQITPSPPPPALPQKGRRSANSQQAHPPEQPPKLPEKKHKLPPPKPSVMQNHQSSVNHNRRYQPENYEDDVEDEDVDGYNVVDESKEWQCTFCTYLNSLEVEVCDMCAKSRRSVLSQHSSHPEDEEEFVSGNSQMDDPEDELDDSEVEEDLENKINCPKCTMYNPIDLNICTVCGASLHKAPITGNSKKRPQSSASRSSGGHQHRA